MISRVRLLIFMIVLICGWVTTAYSNELKVVVVHAESMGNSLKQATEQAILVAVENVNGKVVFEQDADNAVFMLRGEVEIPQNNSNTFRNRRNVKGVVKSYKVVNSEEVGDMWRVEIIAEVVQFKVPESANRIRIFIQPVKIKEASFINTISDTDTDIGFIISSLHQSMTDFLVQTRKFTILDREYVKEIESELEIALSSPVAFSNGHKIPADFLLTNQIESISYEVRTRSMRTSNKKLLVGSGYLSYGYKLIDVSTSQIVFSDSFDVEIPNANIKLGNQISKASISELSNSIAIRVASSLRDQIYPLAITGRDEEFFILSEGSKLVKVGEVYAVYRRSDPILDKYTEELIGFKESYCCQLEVVRVIPKTSYARLVNNVQSMSIDLAKDEFVLREKLDRQVKPLPNKKKVSFKNEDSDW